MIADICTIVWKEWRELLVQRGNTRGNWLTLVIVIGFFSTILPLQIGREWIASPFVIVITAWVPVFLVTSVIADSFAGERERHTLETLLASRLSDRAILLGKIVAGVSYGWGITLIILCVQLVTITIFFGGRSPVVLSGHHRAREYGHKALICGSGCTCWGACIPACAGYASGAADIECCTNGLACSTDCAAADWRFDKQ